MNFVFLIELFCKTFTLLMQTAARCEAAGNLITKLAEHRFGECLNVAKRNNRQLCNEQNRKGEIVTKHVLMHHQVSVTSAGGQLLDLYYLLGRVCFGIVVDSVKVSGLKTIVHFDVHLPIRAVEDRNSRSILVEVQPVYKDGRISSFPSLPQGETQLHLIDLEMPTYGAVFEVHEPSCEFLKNLVMNDDKRLVLRSEEELAEGLTHSVYEYRSDGASCALKIFKGGTGSKFITNKM